MEYLLIILRGERREERPILKASDVARFFHNLTPEVYARETCDGFKFGNTEKEVKKIAVTWMATMGVLNEAVRRGCDMVITHEPTFYNHWDKTEDLVQDPAFSVKKAFLEDNDLTVYRVHDGWDLYPDFGILDSLAKELGFKRIAGEANMIRVYVIPTITLGNLALSVKEKLGLKAIRFIGDPDQEVTRVGIGIGSLGMLNNLKDIMPFGGDCLICGETIEWSTVRYAEDANIGLMPIGHSNSENLGMKSMAEFLKEQLPEISFEYIETPDPFSYR